MHPQIALITGGSSGIGLALSELLIKKGYHVYSVSRNPERGPVSDRFTPLNFDLLDTDKISLFAENFCNQFGVPDILINNAGNGAFYEWDHFPQVEIKKQIDLLFTAPVMLCRSFAPHMSRGQCGTILNLSSLATLYPLPYMPLYNAGKSALSSFTQSMMLEYPNFPKWIDFKMGDVRTDFNKSASKQNQKKLSTNSQNAWKQIEKQLQDSITSSMAAKQIWKAIIKNKSGSYYGGTFFQSNILVIFFKLLPPNWMNPLIKAWYGISKHT
jgi:short-subunit dehydrogenase